MYGTQATHNGVVIFLHKICSDSDYIRKVLIKNSKQYRAPYPTRKKEKEEIKISFTKPKKESKEEDSPWDRITYGTAPPKSIILLGSLGEIVSLFNEVRCQPSYMYALVYFSQLDSNCTVLKELCYSIRYVFIVI